MKNIQIIRSDTWWWHKIVPLITIAYTTALIEKKELFTLLPWLIFLLISIAVGATFVSLINDMADNKQDIKAGKAYYINHVSKKLRWSFVIGCLLTGSCFSYFLWKDKLSFFLYISSWIVFSLYSIRPVRLKQRGIWGVLADASGAHIFPSCLMVSSMCFYMHEPINKLWFSAVAIWALACGVRNILCHQFFDRDNDIIAGVNTFAAKQNPQHFKIQSVILVTIEIISFAVMLLLIQNLLTILFLYFYILFIFFRRKVYNIKLRLIIGNRQEGIILIINEYYQIFFPVAVLLSVAFNQRYGWVILLLHFLIFSKSFYNNLKPYKGIVRGSINYVSTFINR